LLKLVLESTCEDNIPDEVAHPNYNNGESRKDDDFDEEYAERCVIVPSLPEIDEAIKRKELLPSLRDWLELLEEFLHLWNNKLKVSILTIVGHERLKEAVSMSSWKWLSRILR